MRGGASWSGPLVDCDGHPTVRAMAAIAVLASPRELEQLPDLLPVMQEIRRIAPAVGWTLVEETRTVIARATPSPCPPGQEPIAAQPASSAARTSRREIEAPSSAGAHVGRPLHASRRPAGPTCRPIAFERDPHTHDPQVVLENNVRLLNPRLLVMLAGVAQEFPRHRFEVISGYRPSHNPHESSRHAHARALDFRLSGVSRESLRDFARTFPNSGVGYYPNSVFVHLDVRDPDEGNARWTDYSTHGERPRYGHWPPRDTDVARESDYLLGQARRALDSLREREPAPDGPAPAARDDNSDEGADERTSPARPEDPPAAADAPSTPAEAPTHDSDRTAQNH